MGDQLIDGASFAVTGVPGEAVVHERVVPAGPDEVFSALTEGPRIAAWLEVEANVELRIGGPFELLFDDNAQEGMRGSEGCRILAYVPGEMLAFSWNSPPTDTLIRLRGQHNWVVIALAPHPDGTSVRLVHTGMGEGELWDENRGYFRRAWGLVLDALERSFG